MRSHLVNQYAMLYPPCINFEESMRLIDRVGERHERLTVGARAPNKGGKDANARWVCRCDCGNEIVAYGMDLRRGKLKSCGCWNDERIATRGKQNVTHGMTGTRVYRIWVAMLNRCRNKNDPRKWLNYGGRGIRVCDRWLKFENFLSDMGIPPHRMSLDRIDVNGDYGPSNCRWANAVEQAANKRDRRIRLTHNGMTLTIDEWARVLGIHRNTITHRIRRGKAPDEVFARSL